jgi:hypothetical protein
VAPRDPFKGLTLRGSKAVGGHRHPSSGEVGTDTLRWRGIYGVGLLTKAGLAIIYYIPCPRGHGRTGVSVRGGAEG